MKELLVVFCLVTCAGCNQIIVSNNLTSLNDVNCGRVEQPCSTVKYALQKSQPNDIILLDVSSDLYYITRDIIFNKNITLTALHKNRPRPAIAMGTFFEINESKQCYSINISYINFSPVKSDQNHFVYSSGCAYIFINECNFARFKNNVLYFGGGSSVFVRLVVRNTNFYFCSAAIRSEVCSHITFRNCLFYQTSTYAVSIESFQCYRHQRDHLANVLITRSSFYDSKDIFVNGACKINIHYSSFDKTRVSVKLGFLFVAYSNFTNNHIKLWGGALSLSKTKHAAIYESRFENVSAFAGGAIYADGKMQLRRCIFHNTCANHTGSAIFLTQYGATQSYISDVYIKANCPKFCSSTSVMYTTGNMHIENTVVDVELDTKDQVQTITILRGNLGSPKVTKVWNITYSCPPGFKQQMEKRLNEHIAKLNTLQCQRCATGTYSLEQSTATLSAFYRNEVVMKRTKQIKCHVCPVGGVCQYGIKSKENFWGYEDPNHKVSFLPCPSHYCCSKSSKCTTFQSCKSNREGILCGKCKNGYQLSYFDSICRPFKNCDQYSFWIIACIYTVFYAVAVMYLHDIAHFFKRICNKISTLKQQRVAEPFTTRLISKNDSEEESDSEDNTINKCFTPPQTDVHLVVIGIEKIIFFFYQMDFLLDVNSTRKVQHGFLYNIKHVLIDMFNFRVIATNISKLCPFPYMQAVQKENVKIGLVLSIFVILTLIHIITKLTTLYKSYVARKNKKEAPCTVQTGRMTFQLRVKLSILHLALLTHTSLTSYLFKMLNCVQVNDSLHLYINGNLLCHTWWQYLLMVCCAIWVVPFAFIVSFATKKLQNFQLTNKQFYGCIAFPPIYLWYALVNSRKNTNPLNRFDETADYEQKCILDLFEGPFRSDDSNVIQWEMIINVRRFVLTALCTLVINPVHKLFITFPVLLICLLHSGYKVPYKAKLCNWLECTSLALLLIMNMLDMFWAYDYIMDSSTLPGVGTMAALFGWMEDVILTLPFIIAAGLCFYMLLKFLYFKLKQCLLKIC